MNAQEFGKVLRARLPKTTSPVVPVSSLLLHDNLWVLVSQVPSKDDDAVQVAKVKGLMNEINQEGEVHIALIRKEQYSEADVERAVKMIEESDLLQPTAQEG